MASDPSRRTLLGMIGAMLAVLPTTRAFATVPPGSPDVFDLAVGAGRTSRVTRWRAVRPHGTILFSHGALSSPAKYDPLILPWVAAGYEVWAPLHVDSTDHPDTKAFPGYASWRARIEDMRALSRHVGGRDYVAAGHSYGALVALTLGGAAAVVPDGLSRPLRDARAKAVVAFSPPGANPQLIEGDGYAELAVPAFIETGDRDIPPVPAGAGANPDAWRTHLLAYHRAAAGGHRYAAIFGGVDHYFGGLICRPELPGPKQSGQLRDAVALSTLFLDAYGRGIGRARAALDAHLTNQGAVKLLRK